MRKKSEFWGEMLKFREIIKKSEEEKLRIVRNFVEKKSEYWKKILNFKKFLNSETEVRISGKFENPRKIQNSEFKSLSGLKMLKIIEQADVLFCTCVFEIFL